MDQVVVTGGSRGIGKALAEQFLLKGYRVSFTGRNNESVERTVEELINNTGNKNCHGFVCDITRQEDIARLWEGVSSLQKVHIWINNAGISHMNYQFHKLEADIIRAVIDTNIRGTVLASRIVIEGMLKQGAGFLYNMEGFGSDGRMIKGMSIYGTSKRAVSYFSRSLIKEYRESPVNIGTISPGMLVTDLLLEPLRSEPEKNSKALKVFHVLADPVDRVAPWLVSRIMSNKKHGTRINWLTSGKIAFRFLASMFKKRKVKGLPDY